MIDPQLLRRDLTAVAANLSKRGIDLDVDSITALEEKRKILQQQTETLRAERNNNARLIAVAKKQNTVVDDLMAAAAHINAELQGNENALQSVQDDWRQLLLETPNLVHDGIPVGHSEEDNKEVKRWKEPPSFTFTLQDHVALGENLAMMDFGLAVKLAASRFMTLSGSLARLHRALIQLMLEIHTNEHGYREVYMPYLANVETLTGTGQLPKFEADLFRAERDDLYLIPTAEVVVTNIVRDDIVDAAQLPLKYVCHTPCFRREAGSYGRDTRGMLRQHQFEKVELVHIAHPENSYESLEAMLTAAEAILQRLELPYRVVELCSGDIGFAAAKTYDIEVWLPGQNTYREISSCSNCEAFQARRMRARYRTANSKPEWVHTLNGSGVAIGRAMIAIMENFQQADGSIAIPDALRPYMGGLATIKKA